jgi:hypothetical protein
MVQSHNEQSTKTQATDDSHKCDDTEKGGQTSLCDSIYKAVKNKQE